MDAPRKRGRPRKVHIATDDYANAFTGSGTHMDRSSFTRKGHTYLLGQGELQDLYIGDGYAKTICDVPAEDMVRAGVSFEDMDDDKESAILERMEELNVLKHAADAVRWSRGFGGSVWVVGANDGGAFDVPLNKEGIKDIEFIRVYDRWEASVRTRVTDPAESNYNEPELWDIMPATGGNPYIVHHSRMRVFDGEALPARSRLSNQGWGASSLQACVDQLRRVGMGQQLANSLLERSQQAVHGIPNLSTLLMHPDGERMIQKRVNVVDMVRGVLNTVVVDAAENYKIESTGVGTGVNELLDRQVRALSAVSRIPAFKFGEKNTGLSGSSRPEQDSWTEQVVSWQKDILHDPLDWIVTLIGYSLGFGDLKYKLCFNPLYVPNEKEIADTEKVKADTKRVEMETAVGYVGIAALDSQEVRKGLEDEYEIQGDLTIPPITNDE